jgi:hypothetical protein
MNIRLPEEKKVKKTLIMYIIIAIVCVFAIGVAIFQIIEETEYNLITEGTSEPEEYEEAKTNFNNMFTNDISNKTDKTYNVDKIDGNQEFVYTGYRENESEVNNYDVNVNIPYINIDNDIVKEYNKQIQSNFETTAQNILKSENRNIIYTVDYKAYITNDILSLVVRSNLKDGSTAQRVIIQTYNYNLVENKEVELSDLLKEKDVDELTAKTKIEEEIKKAQTQVTELRNLGYNIYERNYKDSKYTLKNTTEFFTDGDFLYLIYAYGNEANTSEMDIVLF